MSSIRNPHIHKFLYLLEAYCMGILFFTAFRLVETLLYILSTGASPDFEGLYCQALLMGWRFDTVVACYILALPVVLTVVGVWCNIRAKWFFGMVHHLTLVGFIISFVACTSDIPYFLYFFTRLNAMAVNWNDSLSIVIDMIVKEPTYIGFALLFFAAAVGYWFLMRNVYRKHIYDSRAKKLRLFEYSGKPANLAVAIPVGLLLMVLCFFGMRGRFMSKSPIRVGTAYFSNNAFINQIGLNPTFTFFKSLEELGKSANKPLGLMDADEAERVFMEENSVPCRDKVPILLDSNTNVVVVIMESMGCDKIGYMNALRGIESHDGVSLTPNLDGIFAQSLLFTNVYSAGIHTYNGVYATLYSHPALLAQHSMKHTVIPQMCGLPQQLRNHGYQTLFCMTHDKEFDNLGGFLHANSIEHIQSQESYPSSEVVGTWGVPDHVMFHHAVEAINRLDSKRPFLAYLLTCSDHGPYVYPQGIPLKPHNSEMRYKMVEYADWAIGQFMAEARRCDWYDNTLFVFVADHGFFKEAAYDLTLSYHHIPIAMFCPAQITPRQCDDIALQIDLGPTLLGMIDSTAANNTLGIDLMRERRPYAYFSADDKIGVLDSTHFYVYRVNQRSGSLYHYRDNDPVDIQAGHEMEIEKMKRYAFGLIQHSQDMLLKKRTGCRK